MTRCEIRKITPTLLAVAAVLILALILSGCSVPTPPAGDLILPPAASAPQVPPDRTEPAPAAQPLEPTGDLLTRAQAEAIALNHAGLTAEQVWGLRSEFDIDDGVKVWDVEFRCDGWEYDYEIHAVSGAIRSFDKEKD
ncbi:MAG: PepSY domain-containing protein [Oscillospiraceae bacterium]|nr:PepSY domain-containing protein [Oscillospiraceae bacterium]